MDIKSPVPRDRKFSAASVWASLMGRYAVIAVVGTLVTFSASCWAQSNESSFQPVNVTGRAPISAYGAPEAFSRSRLGTLTQAYVLPAFTVYTGLDYEFTSPRQGLPDHLFTQELEIGLPFRFGVAMENNVDAFNGSVRESSVSIETRYALADWDKIPLNPTLFAEYRIGIGPLNETAEVGSQPHEGDEQDQGPRRTPNAYELRLLLAEDFGDKVEWALNAFFEQELSGDRGREWGFAQSIAVPILQEREKLKLGIEMLYRNHTDHPTRSDPTQLFELGPSVAWKLTRSARLDFTPLFGTTSAGPAVQTFLILSFLLGPPGEGGEQEPEEPTSIRNR
jgi:hypothetical protein